MTASMDSHVAKPKGKSDSKCCDDKCEFDECYNVATGAVGAAAGAAMVVCPKFVHDNTGLPGDNTLTRVGGSCLLAASAGSILAGISEDHKRKKTQLKVSAAHSAVLSGIAIHKLACEDKAGGTAAAAGCNKNALTAVAVLTGVNAAVSAFRGFKNSDDD